MASMDGGNSLAFDVEDEVGAGVGEDFKDSQGSDQASTTAEARPHTLRISGSGFVGSVHVGPL